MLQVTEKHTAIDRHGDDETRLLPRAHTRRRAYAATCRAP